MGDAIVYNNLCVVNLNLNTIYDLNIDWDRLWCWMPEI